MLALHAFSNVICNTVSYPWKVAISLDNFHCCCYSKMSVQQSIMILFDTFVDFMVQDDSFPMFPHINVI